MIPITVHAGVMGVIKRVHDPVLDQRSDAVLSLSDSKFMMLSSVHPTKKHIMESQSDIPVVLLCGGRGERLRPLTDNRPKPLLEVGEKPMVRHIMDIFSNYYVTDFIICGGYKFEDFERYFESVGTRCSASRRYTLNHQHGNQSVTLVDTGETATKAERLLAVENRIESDRFFLTYGDGLADVDIEALLSVHDAVNATGTVTGVRAPCTFGVLETDGNVVQNIEEKPVTKSRINGGYFIFEHDLFEYVSNRKALEQDVLNDLASDGELGVYYHEGFFQGVDTHKDLKTVRKLVRVNETPPWAMIDA